MHGGAGTTKVSPWPRASLPLIQRPRTWPTRVCNGPGRHQLAAAIRHTWNVEEDAPAAQHGENQDQSSAAPPPEQRTAILKAAKVATHGLQESSRPLADYMALPASQYSVLDAETVERLDDDTFLCHVAGLTFFSFEVHPVLTVSVSVGPTGPTVDLLKTELRGSRTVRAANERFTARMRNRVSWKPGEEEGARVLVSDVDLTVTLELPGWFPLPRGAVQATGNAVLGRVLDVALPRFLKQLEKDYQLWAEGAHEERILDME
ncbi:CGL81 [Auxenochlorella protothecoides x Auxenochlorella symbiontica]